MAINRGGTVLRSISKIEGIGVLDGAEASSFPLERLSLIYAGNGHGKSTLAAAMYAACTGRDDEIRERRTLGSDAGQLLALGVGESDALVYEDGAWSGDALNGWVFDNSFVERNLHTGGEVSPAHRAGMLGFAIGESAVGQQDELDAARAAVEENKRALRDLEQKLCAMAQGIDPSITLEKFLELPNEPNSASLVAEAELRLANARNSARIYAQALPLPLPNERLLDEEFCEVLAQTLDDIHLRARAEVDAHVHQIRGTETAHSVEEWLSKGIQLADGNLCPFCSQNISEVDLVALYTHFFNRSYSQLRTRFETIQAVKNASALASRRQSMHSGWTQARDAIVAWSVITTLPDIPSLAQFDDEWASLADWVDEVLILKAERMESSPLNEAELERGLVLEAAALLQIANINLAINDASNKIAAFRESLVSTSVTQVESELTAARLLVLRAGGEARLTLSLRDACKARLRTAEANAKRARNSVKEAMNQTLGVFEASINRNLQKLNAGFSIENVTATLAGDGATRGNYALNLRGTSIDVARGNPPFRLALSEGDKRTLAFAFFCATILSEADLRGKVVIVDDPVTSLDKHRRAHTTQMLNEMSRRGAQIVILGHDASYLRDARESFEKFAKDNFGVKRRTTEFQLKRIEDGKSRFASVDLDVECESQYSKNYRKLTSFLSEEQLDGEAVTHEVAGAAIRPLIESYLHRRFPGQIPKSKRTLGSAIGLIQDCADSAVLAYAKPLVGELSNLNEFGTHYHHDSGSDAGIMTPDADEVRGFADRALKVVHGAPING